MAYDSKYRHGLSHLNHGEDDPCSPKILKVLYAAIYVYLTRKAAQDAADYCTSNGYPTHVVGPYVLAPTGGRRGRR